MNKTINKFHQALGLDFSDEDKIWIANTRSLRRLIGLLGMALPFLLWLFLFIDCGMYEPLESVSHYYYSRASGLFTAVMSIMAIFLMIYKGKDPFDFYLSFFGGLGALLVVLFPTTNISDKCCDPIYSVTVLKKSEFRVIFHYVSAAIFLGCLAIMSIVLFTKSDKPIKERGLMKKQRNRIYRTCGAIMIIALLVVLLRFIGIIPGDWYDNSHITFWMETLAVECFGISWLIKGETLFKDKPSDEYLEKIEESIPE